MQFKTNSVGYNTILLCKQFVFKKKIVYVIIKGILYTKIHNSWEKKLHVSRNFNAPFFVSINIKHRMLPFYLLYHANY